MSWLSTSVGLATVVILGGTFSVAQPPQKAVEKTEAAIAQKSLRERLRDNQKKLEAVVDFSGVDDPKATLESVLKDLARRYDIVLEINQMAFELQGLKDAPHCPLIYGDKTLPLMKGASLGQVLRKVIGRIPGVNAMYINRGHYVEVTTKEAVLSQVHLDPDRIGRLPLVSAELSKKPLDESLMELASHSGVNIIIDSRTEEKARTPVTANFANVPIDTAVRVLADMAGLKSALLDNVFYITDVENAKVLLEDYRRRRNYDKEMEAEEARDAQENQLGFSAPPRRRTDKENIERGKEIALRAEKKAQAEAIRAKILRMQAQMDELQAELDKLSK